MNVTDSDMNVQGTDVVTCWPRPAWRPCSKIGPIGWLCARQLGNGLLREFVVPRLPEHGREVLHPVGGDLPVVRLGRCLASCRPRFLRGLARDRERRGEDVEVTQRLVVGGVRSTRASSASSLTRCACRRTTPTTRSQN